MKRTLGLSAVCCTLLLVAGMFLQGCGPAPARESPLTAAAAPPTLSWEEVAPGIQVIRIWTYFDPEETTQTALLRLTNERNSELVKDPRAFVNTYRIFPAEVREMGELPEQMREGAPGPEDRASLFWRVMMVHWPDSGGRGAGFLDWYPEMVAPPEE